MNSNKKTGRLLSPSKWLCFVLFILFAAATAAVGNWILAGTEAAVALFLLVVFRISDKRKNNEILRYIDSVSGETAEPVKDTFLKSPLPMVIFDLQNGLVIWSNDEFREIVGKRGSIYDEVLTDSVPGLKINWLIEGKHSSPDNIEISDSVFQVYGSAVKMSGAESGYCGVLYLVDVTPHVRLELEHSMSRIVVSLIVMDNYDEFFKNLNDTAKSSLLAGVDQRVNEWTQDAKGYLSRCDRDRYIFIFEKRYLQGFIDGKFSLLDTVRELVSPAGVNATLSIGIGKDASNLEEGLQYASLSIEMALSRGGDQAVIKDKVNFEFFGGHSSAVERRTKVKSRVMASALSELIADASRLLIMGHKYADLDCIGASAGLCCIARMKDKEARIILNSDTNVAMPTVKRLMAMPEYDNVFITEQEAMLLADSKTLLVVVDTNRPDQVESEPLLISCTRVAVIDHHRRASEYIANAALNFHEPYASSASELVTELLTYIAEPSDLLKVEAEAVLSGIVLDTKNFTMRTGSRTFEAAAFLRRAGLDTAEVKKAFQSDLKGTIERYKIIENARIYEGRIAISVMEGAQDRIIAAKAADELLNISGISASFVIFAVRDSVNISARSMGELNVQVILERLGGGGNMSMAGAQVKNKSHKEVAEELYKAIDWHLEQLAGNK